MGGGLDLTGQRKDGSTFPIEISLNHVSTLAGGKAIAFVTDITTRKQAAEALRQSHDALEDRTGELERRTAQLSRLASELTLAEQNTREQLAKTLHDGLQQLLFIAKMGLDRLPENDVAGRDRAAILAEVQTSIEEAIFASRSLSMELFPPALHGAGLPTAVTWLSDWMKEKYGLVVVATVDPLANSNRRDVRTLVFESLRELLFNAVKHAKVDRVAVDLALGEDDTLCVTVTDQGVGFDPATLFLPGSQKAGVGLFSIRERLMLLHGRFDIESTPWRGTRFRIVVPRSDDRLARVNTPSPDIADELPAARKFAGERVRILIVDDNSAVRAGVRRMLLDRPEFQIVGEASDGLEAIDQSRALQPDAIVMDVSMPKMDGVEATRRIHKEFPFIQIYGLSSAEKTDSPHPIQGAGAAGYFVKGTDMNLLIESLLSITRYRADVFSNTDFA